MRVAVVVVNWNDAPASAAALRSCLDDGVDDAFLVDNGSDRDPGPHVAATCPAATLVRRPSNDGYGAAWNAGVDAARRAGATHVLVLNTDATVEAGAIETLRAEHARRPASILAPLIVRADDPEVVWSAGGTIHQPMLRNHHVGLGEDRGRHTVTRTVPWASGCALSFSVDTFDRVGPVDEAFFLYLEDVEWCLRARARGVPTVVVPAAVVRHAVSATTAALPRAEIRYYSYRNLYRVAFRHQPWYARPVVAGELCWTLAKTGARWVVTPGSRHDAVYHARTRAVRDVLRGRWGRDPQAAAGTDQRLVAA